jgi:biotin carboxyl carrier protein
MKYTAIIEGQRLQLELKSAGTAAVEAEIDGRKYVLEAKTVEPGVYWFNWKDRSIEISVSPNREAYIVSVAGRSVPVEILDSRAALRKAAQQGHAGTIELRAPMPGKVVKVLVSEGHEVQTNQGILVIEAMKMQNEIKSPKKGIVKRLAVIQGTAVNAGDVLATVGD